MKPIFKEDMDVALRLTLLRHIAGPAFKDRVGQGKGAHTCLGDYAINALDENARDINLVAMLGDQLFFLSREWARNSREVKEGTPGAAPKHVPLPARDRKKKVLHGLS